MAYDFNMKKIKSNEQLKYEIYQDIINYDNWYFNQFDWIKYKYIKKRNRIIKTEFGNITYQRRIYKDKDTGKSICPTDLEFGLNPMQRVNKDLKQFILNQIATGKRNKDIKDIIPNAIVSLVTISNILKNSKLEIIKQEPIKINDNEKLYINIDDSYIDVLENNIVEKYCCRIFSFNTGKKHISKNRNQLLNKRIAFLFFKPSEKIKQDKVYNFLFDNINTYYDININHLTDLEWNNNNLVISGDGALWIRVMAKWLGANYVLDKFHAFSYLWKSFIGVRGKKKDDTDWTNYLDTSKNFTNGNYNDILINLENKVDKQTYNYFKNNEQGIINQNQEWNIGCSAESDVYHLLKSQTNGAKIYNYKTLNNMLIARANQINSRI